MGLDVFIHKVVRPRTKEIISSDGWFEIRVQEDEQSREALTKVYDDVVRSLKRAKPESYNKAYLRNIKKLLPFYNYPEYHLKDLGYGFNYRIGEAYYNPVPVTTFEEKRDEILKEHYSPYVGYFRKVNFFYRYFMDRLIDEAAWIEREDIEDIIDRCRKVLKNHKLAEELLPTQCGFFFGSTEYDDWYFKDVKDCLKQMKHLLKVLKEDEQYYVVMSW